MKILEFIFEHWTHFFGVIVLIMITALALMMIIFFVGNSIKESREEKIRESQRRIICDVLRPSFNLCEKYAENIRKRLPHESTAIVSVEDLQKQLKAIRRVIG